MPGDKVIRENFGRDVVLDLTERDAEFENDYFPLYEVFDSRDWFYSWRDYWRERDRDVQDLDNKIVRGVVESIERYKMPIIRLDRGNSREAICLVFEKVNVGGKKLDAFELLTAIYAAASFDLREDWNGTTAKGNDGRRGRILGDQHKKSVLSKITNTDFLQACALLYSRDKRLAKEKEGLTGKSLPQISCNRDALLALPLDAYQKYADAVEQGFRDTGVFLNELKIIWQRDIPYPPSLVTLASVFAILGKDAQTLAAKNKIARWFWSITLGELYGSSTESRLAKDVPDLVNWIEGGEDVPRSVVESIFQQDRLKTLRSRLSAAYKGIHALTMKQGCRDFISGSPTDIMTFFNDKIDIHHIFPKDWCKKQGMNPKVFDSIINKTPLSKKSNITVGGHAPSVYLKRIEKSQGISSEELDNILRSHLIEPEHLRNDDFEAFYEARMAALSGLVSDAMDKAVVFEHGANEQETELDDIESEVEDELEEEAV